jgi:hypothetical protein
VAGERGLLLSPRDISSSIPGRRSPLTR